MGCNCKNREALIEKYSDEPGVLENSNSILDYILRFFTQLFFGIFAGIIIIVMTVPLLAYIIFCLIFGIDIKFKLFNPEKILKKNQAVSDGGKHKDIQDKD